jgi:hypothetical protein
MRHLIRTFSTAKATGGNNLVFLGAPGVGKGTFANKIAPILGIPAISTGDIIRGEIKAGSPLGLKCKEYTDSGRLVPDEVVSAMVRKRLLDADAKNGWILVRFFFLLRFFLPCCVFATHLAAPCCWYLQPPPPFTLPYPYTLPNPFSTTSTPCACARAHL